MPKKKPNPPTRKIDELHAFIEAIESKVGASPTIVMVGKNYFETILGEFCAALTERKEELLICGIQPIPTGLRVCGAMVYPGSDDGFHVTFQFEEIASYK